MINGNVKLYVKRGLNVRRGGQDNRESSSGSCSEDKPIEQSDELFYASMPMEYCGGDLPCFFTTLG